MQFRPTHALPTRHFLYVRSHDIFCNAPPVKSELIPSASAIHPFQIRGSRDDPLRKKTLGSNSTSFGVPGVGCQCRKRFQVLGCDFSGEGADSTLPCLRFSVIIASGASPRLRLRTRFFAQFSGMREVFYSPLSTETQRPA